MKCDYCRVVREDVEFAWRYEMTVRICPDCAEEEEERQEELRARSEWKEDATCPACKGKLRKQGDTDTSILEAGQMIKAIGTLFDLNPVTMVPRFITRMGKAAFSVLKGEESSIVRQCSKCDAYATKCPECSKIFIIGKSKALDGTSTNCPKCEQKLIAFR